MKAYVLAAGYATRMYPLTRDVPKALLEVAGAPILTHLMNRLGELDGLTEIVLVTNARFLAQFEPWHAGYDSPVPITLVNDGSTSSDNQLGAIRDLAFALERVPHEGEPAIVVASDNLFDFPLRDIHREFIARNGPMLAVRRLEDGQSPSQYNEVTLGNDRRVLRFREKPARSETGITAIALYFLPAAALDRVGEYLETGNPDAPGHFISWLVERVPCYAWILPGPWFDIGSVESLAAARELLGRDGGKAARQ